MGGRQSQQLGKIFENLKQFAVTHSVQMQHK